MEQNRGASLQHLRMRPAFLGIALLLLCTARSASATNYLLVWLDDVGVDKIGAYDAAPDPGRTPIIDALAREGLLFRNAWAHPSCTPTRAAALSGRLPELTGVGEGIPPAPGLDADALTLADVLSARGYATAAIGKWHLESHPIHPLRVGFDTHRGPRANVGPKGYYWWRKFIDGVDQGRQTKYATTDTIDDALLWIRAQERPWFMWLAFNAPHLPLHEPPPALHSYGDLSGASGPTRYKAMMEAVDTELGRLLEAIGDDTTVIVMGDNGTYPRALEPPYDQSRGKLSVYESGVHVPLIVAGADVAPARRGRESAALVQSSDLFATIAELAGSDASAEDSVSFASELSHADAEGRTWIYTSRFGPNGGPPRPESYRRAARGPRFKLLRHAAANEEFYDLAADPYEANDLLRAELPPETAAAYAALAAVIDTHEWGARSSDDSSARRLAPLAVGVLLAALLFWWHRARTTPQRT